MTEQQEKRKPVNGRQDVEDRRSEMHQVVYGREKWEDNKKTGNGERKCLRERKVTSLNGPYYMAEQRKETAKKGQGRKFDLEGYRS